MKVANELTASKDENFSIGERVPSKIVSHWNRSDCFELVIEGKSYWFIRWEVEKAIANACNHSKY